MAIVLFYYQGMSYKEVAATCRSSVGTVGSWIHHGVRALRRMLAEPGSEERGPHGERVHCLCPQDADREDRA